jgi:hypothetical protein
MNTFQDTLASVTTMAVSLALGIYLLLNVVESYAPPVL